MTAPQARIEFAWAEDGAFAEDDTIGALWPYTLGTGPDGTIGGTPLIEAVGDVTANVLLGLEAERGRDQVESLSPPIATRMAGTLNNASGIYSADRVDSILYPNVDVGREARWTYLWGGDDYPVARGYLRRLDPHPEWGRQTTDFAVLGQLARLIGKDQFSSPLYTDIRVDEALGVVCDLAEIPLDRRAFDVCRTTLTHFWVRPSDELFALALKLWASEGPGARLFDGADELTHLTSRYSGIFATRSAEVQATFRDTATEPYYVAWEPDAGEASIVNRCSVEWRRRATDAADAVIWLADATVALAPHEARPFVVQPASDDPIVSVLTPAPGIDYVLAAGSLVSSSFDRTSGPFVTWTPIAGASGATLTGLGARGRLARVVASGRKADEIDTTVSRAKYGPKPYTLATLPEIDPLVLQDFCNAVVALNQVPRPQRTLVVPLATDGLAGPVLGLEIGDRVRVINARESFDREMHVEYLRHAIPDRGGPLCSVGCEAASDLNYARWGSALLPYTVWSDDAGTTPNSGVWGF